MMAKEIDLFSQINNAVLDLQAAHAQSYERPLKTLARLLRHPDLEATNNTLTMGLDLDEFLRKSESTQGSMAGSAVLAWPEDHEQSLGLTLLLIWKFGDEENYAVNFGLTFFYSGSQPISAIHQITRQIIIPFVRDFKNYVLNYGSVRPRLVVPVSNKVFIVHGHDGEARLAVQRFIEQLGFEAVVLHERPNKGRTIITKFREEAADVGFAVVLMTPDDTGGKYGSDGAQLASRARQNVVFELGFFIGALGPARVAALVKGNIERPSDFDGVVYISLDNGTWKAELGRELESAGYAVDWNKAMRA